jgi:3'(2'), 5'-bisphosphate nucleotidase
MFFTSFLVSSVLFSSPIADSTEVAPIQVIEQTPYQQELSVAKQAALDAGVILMKHWKTDLGIETKSDNSPVTIADFESNELICSTLVQNFKSHGLLTEEKSDDPAINQATQNWNTSEYCWYVDPLDGTKAFIKGDTDFGIHIGLCRNGIPVLGVNYFPAMKTIYWAVEDQGAYRQVEDGEAERIHVRELPQQIVPIYSSERANAPFYCLLLDATPEEIEQVAGNVWSTGLRITLVAEGSADIFVTPGKNGGLWDYCSSHTILKEAGGVITDLAGEEIDYRNPSAKLKNGYLTCGNKAFHQKALEVARRGAKK